MDPIKRNMTMKKVAGFHSLLLVLGCLFSLRMGFGMRDRQNPRSTTVAGAVLWRRAVMSGLRRLDEPVMELVLRLAARIMVRCSMVAVVCWWR